MQKKNPFILPIILLFFVVLAGIMLVVVLATNRGNMRDVKEVAEKHTTGALSVAEPEQGNSERIKTVVRDSESGETQVEDVTDEMRQVDENLIAAGFLDKDSVKEIYPASDEIINARTDSGSFQISDLLFTMPVSFKTLTDNGVRVISIDDRSPTNTDDFMVFSNSSHKLMCVYNDIVFGIEVLDMDTERSVSGEREAVTLMDVISVWEDMDGVYRGSDNKGHIYFPGGISIGSRIDDVGQKYGKYEYKTTQLVKDSAILYTYGYEGYFSTAPMNKISFKVKGNEDTVSKIEQGKNSR